ncbi:DUF58 domain-containing protein [Christensenella tenuis]|uniref:DUF58 domain-containing protein n=1 Tax=Christensenella tenuis TaxID=2763033 RepID=A0ABR7ECI1_9FIRM|nr:DUF58 domain-containing protein [Christensenella tenuis]MBC5647485.1 DUF58 domain-containing protein [Christensenella tenuis]
MMLLRRIFYLLFCTAVFFYYIFHTGYLSWLLLCVAVSLPVLSILITLLLRRGLHIQLQAGSVQARECSIVLHILPALPYTPVRVRIRFENLFTGETAVQEIRVTRTPPGENAVPVPYQNNACGVIRCSIKSAHLLDLLGLFCLPLRRPGPCDMLSLPREIPFSGEGLDRISETPPASVPSQGLAEFAGEREFLDLRGYRAGDSLRDIHWKLTARLGHPIVREYGFSAASVKTLAVIWNGTPEKLSLVLGRLSGAARFFSEHGPYVILWIEEGQVRRYVSPDAGALEAIFWQALSKPPSPLPNGFSSFVSDETGQEARFLLMQPDAVLAYENGFRKGAVI